MFSHCAGDPQGDGEDAGRVGGGASLHLPASPPPVPRPPPPPSTTMDQSVSVPDAYCFELLSMVLALSGSRVGRSYVAQQDGLLLDLVSLLHTGTPRNTETGYYYYFFLVFLLYSHTDQGYRALSFAFVIATPTLLNILSLLNLT